MAVIDIIKEKAKADKKNKIKLKNKNIVKIKYLKNLFFIKTS